MIYLGLKITQSQWQGCDFCKEVLFPISIRTGATHLYKQLSLYLHHARKSSDVGLVWLSRTPHDAEVIDKIEVCGFNVALSTDSRAYIPSVTAFCGNLLSTYCLKEEGNEHHQPRDLRNPSEMLFKDHLCLPPHLPSLFH